MRHMKKNTAVFLDRDGTINEEVGYLDSLAKLKLYDNTAEALRLINESGMKAIVITNQSGVARGYFTEKFVRDVHAHIQKILREKGAFIDAFYYCPHHPTEGIPLYRQTCTCRKPEAGMVIQASDRLNIDLKHSYIVGDMLKDIQIAGRVGAKGILVKTGYGMNTLTRDISGIPAQPSSQTDNANLSADALYPNYIAEDILDAVKWIMKDRNAK
jgi:D-glycero-D-manno-heptose 1,7-bisphosphate phosphatase